MRAGSAVARRVCILISVRFFVVECLDVGLDARVESYNERFRCYPWTIAVGTRKSR